MIKKISYKEPTLKSLLAKKGYSNPDKLAKLLLRDKRKK